MGRVVRVLALGIGLLGLTAATAPPAQAFSPFDCDYTKTTCPIVPAQGFGGFETQVVGLVSIFESNPTTVFRSHANRRKNLGL